MTSGPLPTRLKIGILIMVSALIWALYAWKAGTTSITHDEAGTFLNVVTQPIDLWSCPWNPDCWRSANNHWLNTLLMRGSFDVFGVSVFSLRMPNLLAFALYLFAAGGLAYRYSKTLAAAGCLFAVLILNPYNLDFLALGRGYGLALGWSMASLYCVGRQCQYPFPDWKWIAAAFACATLAVFSNLTFVGIYVALGAWICIRAWQVRDQLRFRSFATACIIPLCLTALIVWFFYEPVMVLSGGGEFLYGRKSLWVSWSEYVRNSLYGVQYLGSLTWVVVSIASILAIATSAFWIYRRRSQEPVSRFALSTLILSAAMLAFFLLNAFVFNASLPGERKAVVYSPFLAALIAGGLLHVPLRDAWRMRLQLAVIAGLVLHFGLAFHTHSFREWAYDADTRDVVAFVAEHQEDATYDLATEWLFTPSALFYAQVEFTALSVAPYTREIVPDIDATYYYVHPEHVPALTSRYQEVRNFDGRILLKRRK